MQTSSHITQQTGKFSVDMIKELLTFSNAERQTLALDRHWDLVTGDLPKRAAIPIGRHGGLSNSNNVRLATMAKGLRSSTKKSNRAKLRSRVFSPVEMARTERLSKKLLELASKAPAKATEDAEMEIGEDTTQQEAKEHRPVEAAPEAMELDGRPNTARMKSNNPNRVHKKRRSKSKASIVFQSYNKRKGTGSGTGSGFGSARKQKK